MMDSLHPCFFWTASHVQLALGRCPVLPTLSVTWGGDNNDLNMPMWVQALPPHGHFKKIDSILTKNQDTGVQAPGSWMVSAQWTCFSFSSKNAPWPGGYTKNRAPRSRAFWLAHRLTLITPGDSINCESCIGTHMQHEKPQWQSSLAERKHLKGKSLRAYKAENCNLLKSPRIGTVVCLGATSVFHK